ncbi:MAG TPA: isoaspartyl peptidase/L-asparaginase [Acidobacteriota bacterium]|nr:isoaspartyl peptidase/L-asparaginase [Acidobacteriota bacterium]
MTHLLLYVLAFILFGASILPAEDSTSSKITLVIHGGAGTITREEMTPEKEKSCRDDLTRALQAGYAILKKGGNSLDAVEAAVRVMEDSPWFNAGKGSVFNSDGKIEMDAAIMDGSTLKAGAVAAVTDVKNPIRAARAVMEKSSHVFLIGPGAEKFAAEQGLEIVDPKYFYTDFRYQQLLKEKDRERQQKQQPQTQPQSQPPQSEPQEEHFGTVGALALDARGNLAAATSTGGRTNKRYGRVGDSPIIGAGTYANNKTCAVSATGTGEIFLRTVAAYNISALMDFKGLGVKEAADQTMKEVGELGGEGGLIVLDHNGNYALVFNTPGMYRGVITPDGKMDVQIYK